MRHRQTNKVPLCVLFLDQGAKAEAFTENLAELVLLHFSNHKDAMNAIAIGFSYVYVEAVLDLKMTDCIVRGIC